MGCFLGCVIVDGGRGGAAVERREMHGACWGGSSGEGEGEGLRMG